MNRAIVPDEDVPWREVAVLDDRVGSRSRVAEQLPTAGSCDRSRTVGGRRVPRSAPHRAPAARGHQTSRHGEWRVDGEIGQPIGGLETRATCAVPGVRIRSRGTPGRSVSTSAGPWAVGTGRDDRRDSVSESRLVLARWRRDSTSFDQSEAPGPVAGPLHHVPGPRSPERVPIATALLTDSRPPVNRAQVSRCRKRSPWASSRPPDSPGSGHSSTGSDHEDRAAQAV